jgi:MFS transporter, ACS family, pantothenate transporter
MRSWAHEICTRDNEERAIVIATMNEMAYVFQAWVPLIVWQQVDAPQYQKGYITVSVLSVCLIITALTIRVLWARELATLKTDGEQDLVEQGSSIDEQEIVVSKGVEDGAKTIEL